MPIKPDTLMPWIDVEKDLGSYVSALLKAPGGTQVLAFSQWLSQKEYAALLSAHTGVEIRFQQVPEEMVLKNDPTGFKKEQVDAVKFIEEFGFTGGDSEVLMPEQVSRMFG
jgi:hypothetical protein